MMFCGGRSWDVASVAQSGRDEGQMADILSS